MIPSEIQPEFFIVGAAKSGTTSLVHYLNQHDKIFIPEIKEPKYFSAADNVFPHMGPGDLGVDRKVCKSEQVYRALYADAGKKSLCGDASVDYLYFPDVAARLSRYNPKAKIIIILRSPIDRAYSAYMHMCRDGRESLDFGQALDSEAQRRADNWEFFWSYLTVGLYAKQIEAYLNVFDRSALHIIRYEDFKRDPVGSTAGVLRHLGLEASFVVDASVQHNISGAPKSKLLQSVLKRPNKIKSVAKSILPERLRKRLSREISKRNLRRETMTDEMRTYLEGYYMDDIKALEKITGIDCMSWLTYRTGA
jgi:hypothetical protein